MTRTAEQYINRSPNKDKLMEIVNMWEKTENQQASLRYVVQIDALFNKKERE